MAIKSDRKIEGIDWNKEQQCVLVKCSDRRDAMSQRHVSCVLFTVSHASDT